MGLGFTDIDHVVLRVADQDDAVALYEKFGFTVAPMRRSIDATAPAAPVTARHILFQPYPGRSDLANFVVLQTLRDQFSLPDGLAQMLSFMLDTEGPKGVIAYAPDLESSRQAMADDGISTNTPSWLSETSWYDDEADLELPVRVQQLASLTRRMPFVVNGFQSTTLESFRHEPWTVHPNSARYLAGITGVSENLHDDVEFMAGRVFGVAPQWISSDIAIVKPRDIFLRIVSPEGFRALYPDLDFSAERVLPALCGLTFAVSSSEDVRRCLNAHSVPHQTVPDGRVLIARQHARNTLVEFTPIA